MLKVAEREMQKLREEGMREGLRAAEAEMKRIKEEGMLEGLRAAEAEMQRLKEEGMREGLHAAYGRVEDLCEVLGVELTEERKAHLAGLDLAGLEALRRHLKTHRSWPR
jgi:predicted RNA polymerase sigma factor